ncbi:MAG TPA: hypothetical protein PLL30_01050 [Candidatus Krumholzibacteria bacterium]|nr:hypothetical protein [Candidatus Krumholzibacteria bacterium]HPD70349.1 hypothetical protein [Candidatus Krumholzibacteria bacterium]HRY39951.1 hypothetical protein [Candidatus Krumholzibacteria bacterium]
MQTILFRCPACGYRAQVIGGGDRDNEAKLKTMVCRSCKTVVDAVVARLVAGETEFGLPVDRWHAVAALCPHCNSGNLMPWPTARPCPRCEGEMDEE